VAALCEQLQAADPADRMRVTETWLGDACAQASDGAALRLKLLDAGHAIATTLCRAEPSTPCQCGRISWLAVSAITAPSQDLRAGFLALAGVLFAQIDRDHPERPVDRAAAMIRACPQRCWRVPALAAQVGDSPRRLRSTFARRFGIGVTEYVHLARVTRALQIVGSSWKVAAIASDLGYRSKKDCYAAMDRWLGVTPGRLRAWSSEERLALALRLEMLMRHGIGDGAPDQGPVKPAYGLMPRRANATMRRPRSSLATRP
jgi:AraC-like DNA-binding protein